MGLLLGLNAGAPGGSAEILLKEALRAAEADGASVELIRLDEALTSLARIDGELARLVDCRFFAGYDERETAEVLGISDRTVRRRWVQARAWIHNEIAA